MQITHYNTHVDITVWQRDTECSWQSPFLHTRLLCCLQRSHCGLMRLSLYNGKSQVRLHTSQGQQTTIIKLLTQNRSERLPTDLVHFLLSMKYLSGMDNFWPLRFLRSSMKEILMVLWVAFLQWWCHFVAAVVLQLCGLITVKPCHFCRGGGT